MVAAAQPRFITLEGGEGAGKSTQIKLLAESFRAAGIDAITTREPGGSPMAETLRDLVVRGAPDAWDPLAECFVFLAARADHTKRLIGPALAQGKWVLCDRFFDSTVVYQGIGKKLGTDWLQQIFTSVFKEFTPTLTLLLDLDPEAGLDRTHARGNARESRFERMGKEYHRAIREGFLALANENAQRIITIDAAGSAKKVHAAIIETVNARFELALKPAEGA